MIRSKFLFSTILIVLLFLPMAHAQSNFLPGYVINQKGDTLFGNIDYQNWEKNPLFINFRPDKSTDNIAYYPYNLLEFKVMDEKYISATVQVETSPRAIERLETGGKPQFEVQCVFLHTLFQGPKSLYAFQDKSNNDHLYYKEDTTYHLLIYKKYLDANVQNTTFQKVKKSDGLHQLANEYTGLILENKRYVGQLLFYFSDCPSLTAQINKTVYSVPSIVSLYKKYYQSTTGAISFEKKQEKNIVKFGLVAGLSRTTLEFTSSSFLKVNGANYAPSYNFVPALSIEFIQSRNRQKWSLYNELVYSTYQVNGNSEDYLYTYQTAFDFQYLQLVSMIRYTMAPRTVRPFVNAGVFWGYLVGETNAMNSISKITADNNSTGKALDDLRRFEFGYNIGVGLKWKALSFEYRAQYGNGMSAFFNLHSQANRNLFLVGYSF